MKLAPIVIVLSTVVLNLIQSNQPAVALTVNIKCRPPEPGVYTLGWGTSRLIIPSRGRPYSTFRGKKMLIEGTLCQSGDNSGAVHFSPDGTVWAYIKAND